MAFSVTKSFFGTLAAMLVEEVPDRPVGRPSARYVPELETSGFGDATVGQVLDMTTAIDFVENYVGESPTMIRYRYATWLHEAAAGSRGAALDPRIPAHGRESRGRTARSSTTARRTSTSWRGSSPA
jgi:CubicO group peptidase (beta-lactamase class C family)